MTLRKTPSKSNRNMLSMSNIDIERTDWIERYEDDFIIVHNPVFKFRHRYPYRLDMVLTLVCEAGSASGSVNLQPYRVEKNSLLIVLADHIMEAHEVSDDFKGTYIFMSQEFLYGLNISDGYKFYENVADTPCIALGDRMAGAVGSYVEMCRSMIEISDINPNANESLHLLTRLFFLNMGWFLHCEAVGKHSRTRHSDVMVEFISLVKKEYKYHRDVEYYADRMNMTAKYMSTLVKKASGKPALQWIEDYVILDAKSQLASTLNSIQQICYNLNFPTQSFFGRYFKRAVGMSPSEYRHLARIKTNI